MRCRSLSLPSWDTDCVSSSSCCILSCPEPRLHKGGEHGVSFPVTTTQWERKSVNDGATWGKESSEDIMVFKCLQDRKGLWASLLVQMVKNLPAKRQTQVRSLGREDPLEKDMAPHSSTHAWRIPRTEEPGRLQSMGS